MVSALMFVSFTMLTRMLLEICSCELCSSGTTKRKHVIDAGTRCSIRTMLVTKCCQCEFGLSQTLYPQGVGRQKRDFPHAGKETITVVDQKSIFCGVL